MRNINGVWHRTAVPSAVNERPNEIGAFDVIQAPTLTPSVDPQAGALHLQPTAHDSEKRKYAGPSESTNQKAVQVVLFCLYWPSSPSGCRAVVTFTLVAIAVGGWRCDLLWCLIPPTLV